MSANVKTASWTKFRNSAAAREMTIVQLRLFKLKHPELSEYWDALETLIR
jgi:hypothetical protein